MNLKETFIGLLKEARSSTADYSKEVVKKVDQIKAVLKGHESAKHTKIISSFLDASNMMKYWKEQEDSFKKEAKSIFPELFDTEEMGSQLTVETVSATLTLVARAKKDDSPKVATQEVDYETAFEELYSYVLDNLMPRLKKFDEAMKQVEINVDKEISKVEKIKKDNTTTTEPEPDENADEPFDFMADLQARRLTVKAKGDSKTAKPTKKANESQEDLNEGLTDIWSKVKKWFSSKFKIIMSDFEKSDESLKKIKSKFKL